MESRPGSELGQLSLALHLCAAPAYRHPSIVVRALERLLGGGQARGRRPVPALPSSTGTVLAKSPAMRVGRLDTWPAIPS